MLYLLIKHFYIVYENRLIFLDGVTKDYYNLGVNMLALGEVLRKLGHRVLKDRVIKWYVQFLCVYVYCTCVIKLVWRWQKAKLNVLLSFWFVKQKSNAEHKNPLICSSQFST